MKNVVTITVASIATITIVALLVIGSTRGGVS